MLKKILHIFYPALFIFGSAFQLYAQNIPANFSNIGVSDGMTSNWVTSLHRDSEGLMWIGTSRGLNRFDGYQITNFEANAEDSASLSNNFISVVAEDSESNLWVGTTFGLNIKNLHSRSFKRVSLFDYNAFGCNDVNNIESIFAAKNGDMYIGTHEGFFVYRKGNFEHHLIDSSLFSADVNNVISFAEDRTGKMWIGTFTTELIEYNPASGNYKSIPLPQLYKGKYVRGLHRLFIDSNNLLWIGGQAGMYVYDLVNDQWHSELNEKLFKQIGSKVISGIQEDENGIVWIATDGAGLYLYDKGEDSIQNILFKTGDTKNISTNGLHSLYIDNDNIVWVGTYKKGLDYYKQSSKKFRLIQNDPDNKNSLNLNDINCCIERSNGDIWIGTNGAGINVLDRKTGKFQFITVENTGINGLTSNVVVSLFEDHTKNMWIGTYYGGLNKYNPKTGEFTIYKHSVSDSTSISDDRIWYVTEDSNQNIWIGTLGGGLNLYDPGNDSFVRYDSENSNLSGNYVNHIASDHQKRLWISTSDGLSIYNPFEKNIDVYFNSFSDKIPINFGPVISSFEDSRGWHWLCSEQGLIKFDPESNHYLLLNQFKNLLPKSVKRILEDDQGNLWVSSSAGISRISFSNVINDSTFTTEIMNFDETDGLQGREFSEHASLKTNDGELIFAGVNGINIFKPNEIKPDLSTPKLVFTNLKIFNNPVSPGEVFDNRVILPSPVDAVDEIVLKYSENLFTIEFAALTYIHPEKNKYRYQLEGFNENWFETDGTANFATFTNLNNGDYILRVKGSNEDGTWNEEGISLNIKVLPPFWKTWYALLGYAVLFLLLLLGLRFMILNRERLKVELEMEREEAKRIHELDLMKLKFFTNISHEFRTPLSLILSPVEKLLPKFKNLPEEKYLEHIYQNAKKLMALINQLLDFRKMENQGLAFNPSWGNIVEFISSVVASFNDLSENKNIELRLVTNLREFNMMFDKEKLEKILYNLLSNAFKYTHVSGLVIVQLELEEIQNDMPAQTGANLIIKVKDNGIGIHPDNIGKIFNRFYQAENQDNFGSQGSGIGLALTKEYVTLHDGIIKVDSAQGIGTSFTVKLPIKNDGNISNHIFYGKTEEIKFSVNQKEPVLRREKIISEQNPVILIVEDNLDLRKYLKENLSDEYEIVEAENGKHALAQLNIKLPDIILSDIMMPVMDGIEFCKRVKSDKITSHIPFIFLTAKTSEQQKLEGLKSGADDYILKPFNLDILKAKIENLVQLKQNIRKVFNTKVEIEPKDISITSLDEKFMKKAFDIMEEQMGNPEFTVAEFSKEMAISRMQLYNKIVALTGSTPLEFIRILRLKRAARLLTRGQLNVSEVAYKTGFNDPKYFSVQFKKEFSISPSKYGKNSAGFSSQNFHTKDNLS
ncbi:response regulator [Maribellus comscasis]|uniref:histidine kinase n=1 Tax=Maribellus comscasis TaxID=2681766 RepID=A0A6I6JV87_9BACT|nr:two-component regulator propeller domain-containing protein [Maribellus comscasis]QGY44072.1 response regulator [Maribellus comscasis]